MDHQEPPITPTNLDWAMLAAYIDGEGSIILYEVNAPTTKNGKQFRLYICVCNTDPVLTTWCEQRFGGSVSATPKYDSKSKRKCILFKWSTSGQLAEVILTGCLPYFVIKGKQAEIALEFRRTFHKKYNVHNPLPKLVASESKFLSELLHTIKHDKIELAQEEIISKCVQ
jgi:hypothetical protein